MNPYVVEFKLRVVVMAEDEVHAHCVAQGEFREITRDEDPAISVEREVQSQRDLQSGWDLRCIPYGGDGNTRLSEIIGDRAPAQEADDSQKGGA
jgi:hypothetical protein